MTAAKTRIEKDSMGEMVVPADAYWGASTQRAVENFPISGIRFPRAMIQALGLIKSCAAQTNHELGLLDDKRFELITKAAAEVDSGRLDAHFVLDIFQTGSGTSTNMNANEVIANRAKEIGGGEVPIHPNDHVNMSQSSNDVIPTAIHVAAAMELKSKLMPALELLRDELGKKAIEWSGIVKTGRTHLQDATPITLGQEFSGYESQIAHSIARINRSYESILELPLGGTAVGTGVNTHPHFAKRVVTLLGERCQLGFFEAENHFEAQAAKDALVELNGQLKTIACSMAKIANDVRWLGAGPRCSIGELALPEVQPGSSIMPGKVNPVIAESLLMVVAQVVGNDAIVTVGNHSGSIFELNVMMPVMANATLQSIELLAASARNFALKCVSGLKPNLERIKYLAEANISSCTALAPKIGYDKTAKIAKEAFLSGLSVREVALQHNVLPVDELDKALDLMKMTKPGL